MTPRLWKTLRTLAGPVQRYSTPSFVEEVDRVERRLLAPPALSLAVAPVLVVLGVLLLQFDTEWTDDVGRNLLITAGVVAMRGTWRMAADWLR